MMMIPAPSESKKSAALLSVSASSAHSKRLKNWSRWWTRTNQAWLSSENSSILCWTKLAEQMGALLWLRSSSRTWQMAGLKPAALPFPTGCCLSSDCIWRTQWLMKQALSDKKVSRLWLPWSKWSLPGTDWSRRTGITADCLISHQSC